MEGWKGSSSAAHSALGGKKGRENANGTTDTPGQAAKKGQGLVMSGAKQCRVQALESRKDTPRTMLQPAENHSSTQDPSQGKL